MMNKVCVLEDLVEWLPRKFLRLKLKFIFHRFSFSVQKARSSGPTIYLNAGDSFQGTPWFSVYRGKMVAELLNMLAPDAMVNVFKNI